MASVNPSTSKDEPPAQGPIKLFFSYAVADEEFALELEKHLALLQRQGVIEGWHHRRAHAGDQWADDLRAHLDAAQIILLLISADYVASDQNYSVEMARALERHRADEVRVVPILVKPCDLAAAPFTSLQTLPRNGAPVTAWADRNAAWTEVASEIRWAALGKFYQGSWGRVLQSGEVKRGGHAERAKLALMVVLVLWIPVVLGRFKWVRSNDRGATVTAGQAVAAGQGMLGAVNTSISKAPVPNYREGQSRPAPLTPPPVFRGTVIDQTTGKALSGARVWLVGTHCNGLTDKSGAFTFRNCDNERSKLLKQPRVNIKASGKLNWCRDIILAPPPIITGIELPLSCPPNESKRTVISPSAITIPLKEDTTPPRVVIPILD